MLKSIASLLVLGVLSVSFAAEDEADTSSPAVAKADPQEKKPPCCGAANNGADDEYFVNPPCSCPISPFYVAGGYTVYYASRYPTSCNDTPTAGYVYGNYSYPILCPSGNCLPSKSDEKAKAVCADPQGAFPGLNSYWGRNQPHEMPEDLAKTYSRPLVDPALPFISFNDNVPNSDPRYAKVFTYWINVPGAYAVLPANCKGSYVPTCLCPQVIYIAFEVKANDGSGTPPPGAVPTGKATGLNEKSEPTSGSTNVYLAKHNTADGSAIPILVLCVH